MSIFGKSNKVLENTVFFRLSEHNALNLFFAQKKVLRCFFTLFWKKTFYLFFMNNLRIKYNNLFINKALFIRFYVIQTTISNNNITTLKIIVTENNKDNIWNIKDNTPYKYFLHFQNHNLLRYYQVILKKIKIYIFSVICKDLSI